MKKHLFVLFVLVMLVAMPLTGCGAQETPAPEVETKEFTIAVFMPNGGDPYYQNKSYGYVQGAALIEASNPGTTVNVELWDAGGYDKAEKQISQVEDAIQRGVDAIILTAADKQALAPVAEKAMQAGIPVVNDDVLVAADTVTSISENSCNVGRSAAEYIARKLNGQGNVVMMKGASGGLLFQERARCGLEEFARYPGMKVIGEQWHQLNIVEGRRIAEDWVQAFGKDINGVWATNSTVAIGAAEALKAGGFAPGEAVIVAVDFHDEAFKYMADGWITGLIPAQPVKLARLAVTYAYKAALGETVPKVVYTTDEMVVDQEMLPTFDQSDAVAPPGWKPPLR